MSKKISIKFLLLTSLKKKENQISKDRFIEICNSLDISKKDNKDYILWKYKEKEKSLIIDINNFSIYSTNKVGDTKDVVLSNEKKADNLVNQILLVN